MREQRPTGSDHRYLESKYPETCGPVRQYERSEKGYSTGLLKVGDKAMIRNQCNRIPHPPKTSNGKRALSSIKLHKRKALGRPPGFPADCHQASQQFATRLPNRLPPGVSTVCDQASQQIATRRLSSFPPGFPAVCHQASQ